MNVKQLREILNDFDDETTVRFVYNSHDYWHTQIAHEVESVDFQPVEKSDYHNDFILSDTDADDYDNTSIFCVTLS